jgi:hypothetical protein
MKGSEPPGFFSVRKIYRHVSSRRDDVELWIKNINPVDDAVQTRKSKSSMALVLSNCVFAAYQGNIRIYYDQNQ